MWTSNRNIPFSKISKVIIFLLFLIAVCKSYESFSQQVSESENIYVTAFTSENGLRQSMVSQVCQDDRGIVWLVTGDGLHYFDGQEFKSFRVPYNDLFSHTDNLMRFVVQNGPGRLLITSSSSLLNFNIATGRFNIMYRKEGSYPMVFNALINQQPLVWTKELNFWMVNDDKLIQLRFNFEDGDDPLSDFIPSQAVRSGPDEILISGENGIIAVQLKDQISDFVFKAKWFPLRNCRTIAKDRKGRSLILAGSSIYSWHNNINPILLVDTKLKGKLNMFIDGSDNIWLMDKHYNKLYKFAEGRIEEVNIYANNGNNSELLTPNIISIFEDKEHNLWFGTDGNGVLLYSPKEVKFDKSNIGFTRCVIAFNNNIWAGTFNNGLWELSPDLSSAKRKQPAFFNNRIYFLDFANDDSGRLWIVSRNGLEVVNGNGKSLWKYPIVCSQAKFIAQIGDSLLLVCDNKLFRFRTSEVPVCLGNYKYVAARAFLTVGDYYWVGSPYGLYRYEKRMGFVRGKEHDWDKYKLTANPVYGLIFHKGFIWAATGNGVECYYPDGSIRPLSASLNSLKNEVIYDIIPDKQGRTWFTSNNGIGCITANEDRVIFFNSRNNLQSLEFNFNASFVSSDGNLYFGGIRGLNHLNSKTFIPDKEAPGVQLISLFVSDTAYYQGIPPANISIIINRLAAHISGKVFSPDFMNTGLLLYSFKLDNYQQEWSKPSTNPVFTYRNLPPGRYRLFVKCSDTYMNWSKPQNLMSFTISPPFYTRWWFQLLFAITVIGITILVVKKIQQIRYQQQIKEIERQNVLEKERHRISKDMHDEVGASLTRISILSELAKKQQNEPAKAQQTISQISEISGSVVDEMSEIIWAMNPRNDTLDSFTSYVRQYASSYLETAGIDGKYAFPFEIPPWPMSSELRRNLFLTVKEAMHNIVKHSGAGKMRMQLNFKDNLLQIIITDDGKGFIIENAKAWGNGLINMRKRIEESGGRFVISSEKGKGTRIELSANLPENGNHIKW
jgi:signal transduction histidine kinase/ligand-binding sensor domain-containing protein